MLNVIVITVVNNGLLKVELWGWHMLKNLVPETCTE